MKLLRPFLFSLFPFLCLSCATPPPRPLPAQLEPLWQAHQAGLIALTHWELRGRLAVRTDGRGGQAALSWQRHHHRHSIRLNGPLGSGMVRVTQDEHGARLQDAEQRVFEAGDAEELLYAYTGWQLPIASLDWWVRGLPVPELDASRELDDAGRLRILRQQDWEVQYQEYVRHAGLDLPSRFTLRRAAGEGMPAMEARLVIDHWAQVK